MKPISKISAYLLAPLIAVLAVVAITNPASSQARPESASGIVQMSFTDGAQASALSGVQTASASSARWHKCGLEESCVVMKHYAPDNGYDNPIRWRCRGDAYFTGSVAEGHDSREQCTSVSHIYEGASEDIKCKTKVWVPGIRYWKTVWKSPFKSGWNSVKTRFNKTYTCVNGR